MEVVIHQKRVEQFIDMTIHGYKVINTRIGRPNDRTIQKNIWMPGRVVDWHKKGIRRKRIKNSHLKN